MELELGAKVIAVAASSRVIGYAIARELAVEQATVLMNGRAAQTVKTAAERVTLETGGQVKYVVADVATRAGCRTLTRHTFKQCLKLEALVINTGAPSRLPFHKLTEKDWCGATDLLVMSAVRLLRKALDHLRKTHGAVVWIPSRRALRPTSTILLSSFLRSAVSGHVNAVAANLAADGIRINEIAPGHIWPRRQEGGPTDMACQWNVPMDVAIERAEQRIPLGSFGQPSVVAKLAAFLYSPASSFISGASVPVDGGATSA